MTDSAAANLTCAQSIESMLGEHGIEFSAQNQHVLCMAHHVHLAVSDFLKVFKCDGTQNWDMDLQDLAEGDLNDLEEEDAEQSMNERASIVKKVSVFRNFCSAC